MEKKLILNNIIDVLSRTETFINNIPNKDEQLLTDIRKILRQKRDILEESLVVNTTAGQIKAFPLTDPGQPGISVVLQPDGYTCDIDLCIASVYQNPEYMTILKEQPEDVCVMSWASVQDDFTNKYVIRREEIEFQCEGEEA